MNKGFYSWLLFLSSSVLFLFSIYVVQFNVLGMGYYKSVLVVVVVSIIEVIFLAYMLKEFHKIDLVIESAFNSEKEYPKEENEKYKNASSFKRFLYDYLWIAMLLVVLFTVVASFRVEQSEKVLKQKNYVGYQVSLVENSKISENYKYTIVNFPSKKFVTLDVPRNSKLGVGSTVTFLETVKVKRIYKTFMGKVLQVDETTIKRLK